MTEWTEQAVKKWWYRMGEIFGTRWYEQNGPEASNLWQQSITEWTLKRGAAVIEHYRTSGLAHPPNMSEVVHTARTLRGVDAPEPIQHKQRVEYHPDVTQFVEQRLKLKKITKQYESVMLPGEGYGDYIKAMYESGLGKAEFDKRRLARFKETPCEKS